MNQEDLEGTRQQHQKLSELPLRSDSAIADEAHFAGPYSQSMAQPSACGFVLAGHLSKIRSRPWCWSSMSDSVSRYRGAEAWKLNEEVD
jgi:hypothetical protein